jgi:hypothetical protein
VGYDGATQTLEIAFHNGGIYQYFNVPESIYLGLLAAGSKGSYHHTHIKNRYHYRKVR